MVIAAMRILQEITKDYEVIVVNDGSMDFIAGVPDELSRIYPQLRVIHHR